MRGFYLAWGSLLALVIRYTAASSVSVFDVETGEANQVSMLTPSGLRPTIGWTLTPEGGMSLTVAVRATNIGWIGVGVSSTNGLGSSIMYGGRFGGGAVIARLGPSITDPVQEYSLTGPSPSGVTVYDATPLSLADVGKCVTDFCITQAQVCLGQTLCSDALKCGQLKFANLTQNLNTSSSVGSTINFISDCAAPLSDPRDPDQIAALAALLDAGGCVVSSCTKKLLDRGLRLPSLNSSSVFQNGTSTILQMKLRERMIGGIPMDPQPTAFMVAFGPPLQPGPNPLQAHQPGDRAYASFNIENGQLSREVAPSWILPHVVLCFIGFGLIFPLSLVLRAFRSRRLSFLPLTLVIFAIIFASIGSVLVTTFSDKPEPGNLHTVISVLSIFMVVLFFLLSMVQPVEQVHSDDQAWKRAALVGGLKQNQIDAEARSECRIAMSMAFRFAEVASIGLIIGAFISGQMSMESSVVEINPAFKGLGIAAIVFCAIGLFLSFTLRCFKRPVSRTGRRPTLAESGSPGTNSPNPGYAGNNEMDATVDMEIEVVPLFLTWENVTYITKPRRGKGEPKQILKNAIGYCAPRTLTAILGPSGAGKSTLMELLAMRSRAAPEPLSRIYINGISAGSFPGIHRLMGFVPQQDVLHEYLTVLETLQFTCKMILPEEMSESAKVDRMLRVVAQLGIGHVLDTRVGGETIRGLSGGERRRISIALQMLKSPSMLFLDEPTSGLDAHLALRLVKVLRELANEGRTIFATIHQPSAACFELFDRVILLSGGYTVYSGPRTGVLQFMKEVDRDVPMQWNPADWLLTVIDFKQDDDRLAEDDKGITVYQSDKMAEATLRKRGVLSQKAEFSKYRAATSMSSLTLDVSELRDNVRAYYQQVNPSKLQEAPGVVEEIVSYALSQGLKAVDNKLVSRYKVSILPMFKPKDTRKLEPCTWEELAKLITTFASSRYAVELVNNIRGARSSARASLARMGPSVNTKYIMQHMNSGETTTVRLNDDTDNNDDESNNFALSFMNQVRLLSRRQASLVWRNPQALKFQAAQNILFGILLGALYSNVKFLKASPFQQSIVMAIILAMVAFVTLSLGTQVAFNDRLVLEREMADAMYSPIGHFVSRLIIGIPVAFVVAMCLIVPAYFWVGLKPDGDSFFFFCLVNAAVVFLFDSVVFALTLFVNNVNSAYAIGNFYEAITIFFSGVFLPIYAMPIFFRWLYFLSPFSYAFGAVVVNEFLGSDNEFTIAVAGVVIRSEWPNLLILFGMGVIWRGLGLIGVIRLFRRKRPGARAWHLNLDQETPDIKARVKSPRSPKDKVATLVTRTPQDMHV